MDRNLEGDGVKGLIKATPRRLRAGVRTLRDKVEDALRYVAAWLFGFFFLLLLVGIPVLLFITSTAGLGDAVTVRSEALLGGKNYEVHLEKVLFSPARGSGSERTLARCLKHASRAESPARELERRTGE
jgi:hypothetical protein